MFETDRPTSALESAQRCYDMHRLGQVPDYEEILHQAYRKFLVPGDNVVDIGVHKGLHFTRFLDLVGATGRAIGFEPVPDFANVAKERAPGSDIRQMALSSEPGQSEFLFMVRAEGESGFRERETPADRGIERIPVEISTLDIELFDLESLKFIKIDTEGHEIPALTGGMETLKRFRPFISVEYGSPTYSLYGYTKNSLFDFASSIDYSISDLFGNVVKDLDEWLQICDFAYWDYFIVPKERAAEWRAFFA